MAMHVETNPLEAAYAAILSQGLVVPAKHYAYWSTKPARSSVHHFNIKPYERRDKRSGHTNGFKPKTVMTRMGEITFAVPQVHDSSFYPSVLDKGSRT